MTTRRIVLAFDIERSGATNEYDTIAIGASVVNQDFEELDSLFLPGYFPQKARNQKTLDDYWKSTKEHVIVEPILTITADETVFEPKCWTEFWSKNLETLETLKYTGPLTKQQRQKEMIEQFQNFRANWESWANENNYEYLLVSDNNVFDGGFINQMIYEHLPDAKPIPYYASTGEYSLFVETYSAQKGLLMYVDPEFTQEWGLTDRINKLFDVPELQKSYDHNPVNDAYTIAVDQQILFAIQNRSIELRNDIEQSVCNSSESCSLTESYYSTSESSQPFGFC